MCNTAYIFCYIFFHFCLSLCVHVRVCICACEFLGGLAFRNKGKDEAQFLPQACSSAGEPSEPSAMARAHDLEDEKEPNGGVDT